MKFIDKHASTIILAITYLFAGMFTTALIGYHWYVLQYGWNNIVASILMLPDINIWQAGGVYMLVSLLTGVKGLSINAIYKVTGAKMNNWSVFVHPFVIHAILWILVQLAAM
jgi:hypothetical protein